MKNPQFRIVGANGQVSIGKKFSGKLVLVEEDDNGNIRIMPGEFIPDTEKWLHKDGNLEKIEEALEWARNNPPQDNFDKFIKENS